MAKEVFQMISWNVNGLRAVLKKEALGPVMDMGPDVLCLQETKMCAGTTPDEALIDFGYRHYNYAEKKGYSGTAILSKVEPISVVNGLIEAKHEHPEEGRVITVEFDKFYLVTVYTPNSQNELRRLPYRELAWDLDFLNHLRILKEKKEVVVCGDLNVAHQEIDIARPKENRKNAGFTDEERSGFSNMLEAGFVDTFRELYPDLEGAYSWWSFRAGARARNVGWRLDYFLASEGLREHIQSAEIFADLMGSDHAPVGLTLAF